MYIFALHSFVVLRLYILHMIHLFVADLYLDRIPPNGLSYALRTILLKEIPYLTCTYAILLSYGTPTGPHWNLHNCSLCGAHCLVLLIPTYRLRSVRNGASPQMTDK